MKQKQNTIEITGGQAVWQEEERLSSKSIHCHEAHLKARGKEKREGACDRDAHPKLNRK